MLFVSTEDFFAQAEKISRLSREDERHLAREMGHNMAAREQLLGSYLPMIAASIRRAPKEVQTLRTVYICLNTLEKAADSFDFQQDRERFANHLSRLLRQSIIRCIADRK